MKEQLRIGKIPILFIYQFKDFFGSKLEQYRTDDLGVDFHTLEVYVSGDIKPIDGEDKLVINNKTRIRKNDKTYIITYYEDHSIKHLITYTNDYKHLTIRLNKNLKSKLAEYEYILSGMMFFEIAISHQYLPIHASAIAIGNDAILLSGPSRSGKSTQTGYLREVFSNSIIINEDKPLIFEKDNELFVCGSPWSGKLVLNQNIEVRLKQIFFINQANHTEICPLDSKEKLHQLMRNIHRPGDEAHMKNVLSLVDNIINHIETFKYNCVNDPSSSQVLKQFLEG